MEEKLVKVSTTYAHMLWQNIVERFANVETQQPQLLVEMDGNEEDRIIFGEYIEEVIERRSLEQAIVSQVIHIQSICDSHEINIGLQDFLLK